MKSDGIQYAKLSSMLDFKEVDPNHTVSYKFNWFHQLPVKSKKIVISKQNVTPVVEKLRTGTFIGQADWETSKTKKSIKENWEHAATTPNPRNKGFFVEMIRDCKINKGLNIYGLGNLSKVIQYHL